MVAFRVLDTRAVMQRDLRVFSSSTRHFNMGGRTLYRVRPASTGRVREILESQYRRMDYVFRKLK